MPRRRWNARRPALPLPERLKRKAEIVLRHRPVERNALAGSFLQRRAKGRDRLLKTRRPALPLPERLKRNAEIHLRRRALARPFLQRGERESGTGKLYGVHTSESILA